MADKYCAECKLSGPEQRHGAFHGCFEDESVFCESLLVPPEKKEFADESLRRWRERIKKVLERKPAGKGE